MFGNTLKVENSNLCLILRQPRENDIPYIVRGMNDWEVMRYLGRFGAMTPEIEREWIDRTARDNNSMVWTIQVHRNSLFRKFKRAFHREVHQPAIGNTGIHGLGDGNNCCSTGCVIWDKNEWGNGVASLAHIARTWFAARQLGMYTIHSGVYSPNIGSWKALERVGYTRTGTVPRCRFVDGRFVDKYTYTWINPEAVNILFPEGLPPKYAEGVEKAKITLEKGDRYVKYV